MKTTDDYVRARNKYRGGVTVMLDMGGLADHIPQTERDWVLFDTNQHLRDIGVGKPLPWPDRPTAHTPEEIIAALQDVGAAAK